LPPLKPDIFGKTTGSSGETLEFTFVTTDPNNDKVNYFIEWGDGNTEEWVGPYISGHQKTFSHTYNKKTEFLIRCKAKDVHDEESEWGTLELNIPRNRITNMRSSLVSSDLFANVLRLLRLIMPRYT
jgi:hypothetical protein